jgi:hypothetical protein
MRYDPTKLIAETRIALLEELADCWRDTIHEDAYEHVVEMAKAERAAAKPAPEWPDNPAEACK